MTSKFFSNKHTNKKTRVAIIVQLAGLMHSQGRRYNYNVFNFYVYFTLKVNKNANSKGKGSNMGIRKVGRGN